MVKASLLQSVQRTGCQLRTRRSVDELVFTYPCEFEEDAEEPDTKEPHVAVSHWRV